MQPRCTVSIRTRETLLNQVPLIRQFSFPLRPYPPRRALALCFTIGRRHTRNDGVHLHQGFHIYGTDNSLEKGYSGYERVLKEDEQNPMKSTSNISETPSGELMVVVTPENDQSRNARVALLRATSMKAIYPPEGSVMFDEI